MSVIRRDGRHRTLTVGQQTVSASISIIPAWVASVPVTCAGNDAHYVALRQRDGLIEAKEEEASTGKRAIAKRFLVDRLVAASPRMELDRLEAVWTNCLAKAPCHQLAILDQDADANLLGITRDGGRYYDMSSGVTRRLLLHPGRYTVRSRSPNRADTFDLAAGHRYQLVNKSPFVGKSATWFEDVATKRVVAGAKSCSTDVDCPESACSKGAAKNAAVCEISELMCTNYAASPGTNVRRCIPQSAPR